MRSGQKGYRVHAPRVANASDLRPMLLTLAQLSNRSQALCQRTLLAVVAQLQESLVLGLGRHQLLLGHPFGPAVRVVVALAAAQGLGAGVVSVLEIRRRDGRAVLAHPLASLAYGAGRRV